jgi:hypothetical protein
MRGFYHHNIVPRRLAPDHAMHRQEAGRFLDWKLPFRTRCDVKMRDAGIFFVEKIGFAQSRRAGLQMVCLGMMRLFVSADYFHVHPSVRSLAMATETR